MVGYTCMDATIGMTTTIGSIEQRLHDGRAASRSSEAREGVIGALHRYNGESERPINATSWAAAGDHERFSSHVRASSIACS